MSERQFILSCESTVDLPYAYVAGRDIPILFYSYMIDGETFIDDMGRDPESIPAFYRRLEAGICSIVSWSSIFRRLVACFALDLLLENRWIKACSSRILSSRRFFWSFIRACMILLDSYQKS